MENQVTRREANAKFKLMALDDEDLQPLGLELDRSKFEMASPFRPIPFWQSNFMPQGLQLPAE